MLNALISGIQELILNLGGIGIFVGMFLGSSVIPVPSEALLVATGLAGLSPIDVAIFGGIGSTLGSIIAYFLGRFGGRPFFEKYGKYFFVGPKELKLVDKWFKKYGKYGVLFGRLIPIVPHKVFSISSGFGKMNFKNFLIFTFIGSVPRCFLLAYFGFLLSATKNIPLIIVTIIAFFAIPVLVDKINSNRKKK